MTESAFSSSAQAAIQRPVVLDNSEARERLSAEQLSDYYELEWTANEIISKNYKRVSAVILSTWMDLEPRTDCPPISRRTSARFRSNLS